MRRSSGHQRPRGARPARMVMAATSVFFVFPTLAFSVSPQKTASGDLSLKDSRENCGGLSLRSLVANGEKGLTANLAEKFLECTAQPGDHPGEGFVRTNLELALRARREVPSAAEVPEDIFLSDVVPYVNLDEPTELWRQDFFAKLKPYAQEGGKSLQAAAEAVVPRIWDKLGQKPLEFKGNQTPAIMSPGETLEHGYASCTGLSILAADGLRSVGIPARVVGIQEWNRKEGGNHNWVEVWTGAESGWRFFDAVPAKRVDWDKTWFSAGLAQTAVAGGPHGISTVVWDKSQADTTYKFTWREPVVSRPALDRTAFYKAVPTGQAPKKRAPGDFRPGASASGSS